MIVVDALAIGVGRDAKVATARVERRQRVRHLPLAVQIPPIGHVTDFSRVAWSIAVEEAREALMEVVVPGVATALVKE